METKKSVFVLQEEEAKKALSELLNFVSDSDLMNLQLTTAKAMKEVSDLRRSAIEKNLSTDSISTALNNNLELLQLLAPLRMFAIMHKVK